jgi:hypothetical protein
MATKAERLEMLGRLLAANGVVLGRTDEAVQELNDWFLAVVEADPEPPPGRIYWPWLSVCHDVAIFIGEVTIERHPNLHWEFDVWGKTGISYQRHVIMGFSGEDPKYHTNFRVISTPPLRWSLRTSSASRAKAEASTPGSR